MQLNIKDSLSKVKIYGRCLSEFLLPDQVDILAKSLQKDIEQKLTLTDVVGQSEQLSKRPNTSSTMECFTRAEKQNKGNV